MRRFNPNSSLLAGMDTTTLRQSLDSAQKALLALDAGGQGESYSYTQADGSRSVSYTRANREGLAAVIQLMQAQLGIVDRPRRPLYLNMSRR